MNRTIRTKVSAVRCVQASRCRVTGQEMYTIESEHPRAIHAQLLTHGALSKNSSSTRAVPLATAIDQVLNNPAKYIWTKNQSGMQGVELSTEDTLLPDRLLAMARDSAISFAKIMNDKPDIGGFDIHKQNAGRLIEPYQNIKVVLSASEWENWDWLRYHKDAQGEIADLANAIKQARDTAEIMEIDPGEWHVPYVERERMPDGTLRYFLPADASSEAVELTMEEARRVSSSVCAQVSYRRADSSLEKAKNIEGMLIDGHRVHASPFEHQASPIPELPSNTMNVTDFLANMPEGVTHIDRFATPCSGNLKNWIQYRQLIKNHDKALF